MTQAVAGSLYDIIQKESMQKGMQKAQIIEHIKFLCALLQNFPALSDMKAAQMTSVSLETVQSLRILLKNHTVKTAGKQILKTYFKNIELTKKEAADIIASVKSYYKNQSI